MPEAPIKPSAAAVATGSYRAPAWLRGGHAQTIFPYFLRRPVIRYQRERIDTQDGDFWDLDWLPQPRAAPRAPLVALFHGLEGSAESHYALALMAHLTAMGWCGVVPHFRGCAGEPNRQPRAYHSGDHEEIGAMLATLAARREAGAPLFAVGVSLGGSALLNWLGRAGATAERTLTAAAAVSAPLDLTAAGIAIGRGVNRIYTRHFLQTLKPKALAMEVRFPGLFDRRRLRATQAGLLVGIGALLAVPAGLIPAAVIISQGSELHFAMPWSAIAVVLIALPAAAAAGAWLLTRPARWSPPATWAD